MKFEAQLDGAVVPVEVTGDGGRYRVTLGGDALEVDARPTGEGGWSLLLGRESFAAGVSEKEGGVFVVDVDGETYSIRVEEETRYIIRTRGGGAAARGRPSPQYVSQIMRAVAAAHGTIAAVEGSGRRS